MLIDLIIDDIADQAKDLTERYGSHASHHESYGILKEELDEYFDEVRKKRSERDPEELKAELIDIASACAKAIWSMHMRNEI